MKSPKYLIAAAAMSGLLAGAANWSMAVSPTSFASRSAMSAKSSADGAFGVKASTFADDTTKGKHDCKGKNACKGEGGCKAGDNGCKGKNSCKGHGGCKTNDTSKDSKLLAAAGLDLGAMALAFADDKANSRNACPGKGCKAIAGPKV